MKAIAKMLAKDCACAFFGLAAVYAMIKVISLFVVGHAN